ncbi:MULTISPECIES: YrhB domain-containing protein [Xanthomonas]|uniref:Immunity protein 35 domain-containing protein n=1 Tax=Xanthomonas arboricola TaxID=56448 RepID=A0AB73GZI7_9XANT|nr:MULTISPECIES: YrhB domain-containing protein [Xanthomonas]MBB5671467.1 hypothetical protein [Xanthomonas arboricola]QWM98217.1 hypothetical protein DGN21_01820 [Xanthomonas sp. MLO165]
MMLTRTQAQALVEARLSTAADEAACDVVVVDSATIERSFDWPFFYESRLYLETGELVHRLAGNAPLIVNRFTGEVVLTGTAHPTDYYLTQYEASLTGGGA